MKGKRLLVLGQIVNRVHHDLSSKVVRVEYVGPTKAFCVGCGLPFLFQSEGRGR
jgi:hypothetical protein